MKKIYFQFVAYSFFLLLFLMASCKKDGFLGQTTTSNLTEETVFKDSANTVGFLAGIYANVNFSFAANRFTYGFGTPNGGLDAASDEAEVFNSGGSTALAWETGTINAAVATDDAYRKSYTNIRAVNQLLKNLPKSPINTFTKTQMKAEARFLRAWYYAILLKHYGGIHLVGDSIYNYTDKIPAARNTYEQCVNYIVAELDAAAQDLPTTQTGVGYGRASKGACLALKARVLLYAASPLFNGQRLSGTKNADVLGYPSENKERWKAARDAASAVISLNAYTLYTDNSTPGIGFQTVFTMRFNTEYIFPYMSGTGNVDLENLYQPPSRTGQYGAFPLQGLVDAFPMKNGKAITDATSGYNPQDPYAGRDPRLDFTVIRDQTLLQNRLQSGLSPVNIYQGTFNGVPTGPDAVHRGTVTGYYGNKMLAPSAVANDFIHRTDRVLPLIRYSEILLSYAEAANEYEGPTNLVYAAVEAIRQRAGLSPYQLPVGLSQADMRQAIRNERRIELAFEEQRFWDVRRWKIADATDNIQTTGMEVNRTGTAVTYTIFPVRKRNFRTAMYLWPIPQSEVAKSAELIQNPGY
ncbi:RagB/SusD family nutrient uptake outer membrane protein [Mucilaginibacter psychrotolerans]|uniref:RagB/SusD family nutrient uptake outer membrane protein n=1 Tax=Mucilaginibacter psychrotolerans TaxID=1524096 RepID=A0A4Y8SHL4_9SPHI|nr:RagB/SusD family nutrient uptake outer membrane protein [Mucilaginibacter psychrotolerans]TFF38181.1 RagB/SusD family nutrient uptake outer membrane protein [Mucilaginibacter psychrotolerans]